MSRDREPEVEPSLSPFMVSKPEFSFSFFPYPKEPLGEGEQAKLCGKLLLHHTIYRQYTTFRYPLFSLLFLFPRRLWLSLVPAGGRAQGAAALTASPPYGSPPSAASWTPAMNQAAGPYLSNMVSRLADACMLSYEATVASMSTAAPPVPCRPPPFCPLEGSLEMWIFAGTALLLGWVGSLVSAVIITWVCTRRGAVVPEEGSDNWSTTPTVGSAQA